MGQHLRRRSWYTGSQCPGEIGAPRGDVGQLHSPRADPSKLPDGRNTDSEGAVVPAEGRRNSCCSRMVPGRVPCTSGA